MATTTGTVECRVDGNVEGRRAEAIPPTPLAGPDRLNLTEALWGIRWREYLPRPVAHDVTAVLSSFEQAVPFVEAHYPTIFENRQAGQVSRSRGDDLIARYYRMAGDFFEFKQGARTVALLIGTVADWSTYYIRSAAALPEFQGRQVMQPFFREMLAILRDAGAERVEADTSPSNMAMLHLLSRLRFNPSGTVLTDRWQALVRFTRFLDESAERAFIDRFCTGVHYQLKETFESRRGPRPLQGD